MIQQKKIKNTAQNAEAKIPTSKDHAAGKPSSEKLNKARSIFFKSNNRIKVNINVDIQFLRFSTIVGEWN